MVSEPARTIPTPQAVCPGAGFKSTFFTEHRKSRTRPSLAMHLSTGIRTRPFPLHSYLTDTLPNHCRSIPKHAEATTRTSPCRHVPLHPAESTDSRKGVQRCPICQKHRADWHTGRRRKLFDPRQPRELGGCYAAKGKTCTSPATVSGGTIRLG